VRRAGPPGLDSRFFFSLRVELDHHPLRGHERVGVEEASGFVGGIQAFNTITTLPLASTLVTRLPLKSAINVSPFASRSAS
jgi:hypothetical protein